MLNNFYRLYEFNLHQYKFRIKNLTIPKLTKIAKITIKSKFPNIW